MGIHSCDSLGELGICIHSFHSLYDFEMPVCSNYRLKQRGKGIVNMKIIASKKFVGLIVSEM